MTEKELLYARVSELKTKAEENSIITSSNFLAPEQVSEIVPLEKVSNKYVSTYYYGGYEDAQRVVSAFVPVFFEFDNIYDFFAENEEENPICLLKLKKDNFSSLSHRDYLGAIMGLGIEREMIGDIVISEDGAYVFCLKKIAEYICKNLEKAGRGKIESSVWSIKDFENSEENTEEVFSSVASLRLDNIVAASFNLSRSSACVFIKQGSVFLNNSQCMKTDTQVKQDDKIVLRGKGKTVLKEIKGETKKGRIHIIIKRYK